MLNPLIGTINEAMLAQLAAFQVAGRRDLEFKRSMQWLNDGREKAFSIDVTSIVHAGR
ncbi:MAG: hypothetical protein AABZ73_03045 [Pseudomonadota bacterium]|uniref:hypothetical protein n=1 Tax=Sphingobium sp. TaxID=1912891 RepID=UPI002E1C9055